MTKARIHCEWVEAKFCLIDIPEAVTSELAFEEAIQGKHDR